LSIAPLREVMEKTYVRLLCPSCEKAWEARPGGLPSSDDDYECPDCGTRRATAEFTRTRDDLQTLKQLG